MANALLTPRETSLQPAGELHGAFEHETASRSAGLAVVRFGGKLLLSGVGLLVKTNAQALRGIWDANKVVGIAAAAAEVGVLLHGIQAPAPSEEDVHSCSDAGHMMVQIGGNDMIQNAAETVLDAPGRFVAKINRSGVAKLFGAHDNYIGYTRSTQALTNELEQATGYAISPERILAANPKLFKTVNGKPTEELRDTGARCVTVPGPIVYGFAEADGTTTVGEYRKKFMLDEATFAKLNPGLGGQSVAVPAKGLVIKWNEKYDTSTVLRPLATSTIAQEVPGTNKQTKVARLLGMNVATIGNGNQLKKGDLAYLPFKQTSYQKEHHITAQDIADEYADNFQELTTKQTIEPPAPKHEKDIPGLPAAQHETHEQSVAATDKLIQQGKDWKHRAEAMRFFMDYGLTDYQAAAIVGNCVVESAGKDMPADIHQFGGGPAVGICQWEGGRRDQLEAFAAKHHKPWTDFGIQLQFIVHEFETSEAQAYHWLKNTEGPTAAADAVMNGFERPKARILKPRLDATIDTLKGYRLAIA